MEPVTGADARNERVPAGDEGIEEIDTMEQAGLPELAFVHPIPGFTGLRRFVLVQLDGAAVTVAAGAGGDDAPEKVAASGIRPRSADGELLDLGQSPLYEMRSLEQEGVRFMVAAPNAFFSDYEIELNDQECDDLGLTDAADALILVMLTVGADAASTTANLLAPVVINARTLAAAQVILTGSDWPVRVPLG